jgi:hypothetical protein
MEKLSLGKDAMRSLASFNLLNYIGLFKKSM